MNREVIIVGYSGHAFVVADALLSSGYKISGYCEQEEKTINPYNIRYLGTEDKLSTMSSLQFVVGIGDNTVREKVQLKLVKLGGNLVNAIHPSAVISSTIKQGLGNLISAGAVINSMAEIGNGVICNTNAVIEHECVLEDFVHIGPGATLCGNVHVGNNTLIGAGSVVLPNIKIGKNVIIGAGSVVVKNVPDHAIIKGNPAK